jgi:hypothetical protein
MLVHDLRGSHPDTRLSYLYLMIFLPFYLTRLDDLFGTSMQGFFYIKNTNAGIGLRKTGSCKMRVNFIRSLSVWIWIFIEKYELISISVPAPFSKASTEVLVYRQILLLSPF